jgi:hypothetical protein
VTQEKPPLRLCGEEKHLHRRPRLHLAWRAVDDGEGIDADHRGLHPRALLRKGLAHDVATVMNNPAAQGVDVIEIDHTGRVRPSSVNACARAEGFSRNGPSTNRP